MKIAQKNFKIVPKLIEFNIYADGISNNPNEESKISENLYLRIFDPEADYRGFYCEDNDENLTKLCLDIYKDGICQYCLDLQFYIKIVDLGIKEYATYVVHRDKIGEVEYACVKNSLKKGFLKNVLIAADAIVNDFVK
jgi:hypothetical protein